MEKSVPEQALKQIEELVDSVKKLSIYQKYNQIEEKMKKNKEIMQLVDTYKKTQQQLVREQNKNNKEVLQNKLDQIEKKLYEYPIYIEHQELQEQLNNYFQTIKDTLSNYFEEKVQG